MKLIQNLNLPVDEKKSFNATAMKNAATPIELTTINIQIARPTIPNFPVPAVPGTKRQPCKLVFPQNSLKFISPIFRLSHLRTIGMYIKIDNGV